MRDQRQERLFTDLYRAEYGRVLRYVARRVDEGSVAEDLTAEVFRVAWDRMRDGSRVVPAWLYVTARHTLSNHYRSAKRMAEANQILAIEAAARDGAHGSAYDVRAAMGALGEHDRYLLVLRYWDGLDGREIAALLGISVSATWVRLHRARRSFANSLRAHSRDHRVRN